MSTEPSSVVPGTSSPSVLPNEAAGSDEKLTATTVVLVKLGGRIYRGAILQSGKKTRLRAAWRSAND